MSDGEILQIKFVDKFFKSFNDSRLLVTSKGMKVIQNSRL